MKYKVSNNIMFSYLYRYLYGYPNDIYQKYDVANKILSQDEFMKIIKDDVLLCDLSNKMMSDKMMDKNVNPRIYICEDDEDNNLFYVAHLKPIQVRRPITLLELHEYEFHSGVKYKYWAHGFDLYIYHKYDTNNVRLIKEHYYTSDIKSRCSNLLRNDLITIYHQIKQFNKKDIHNK